MKQNYKIRAESLLNELQRICDERAISFYELAILANIDKNTLYRLHRQNDVQIRTVKNLAHALNCTYKIDEERNVTFITARKQKDEYQESRRIDLKQQLVAILDDLNESSLENLLEILVAMQEQGKLNHATTRKDNFTTVER